MPGEIRLILFALFFWLVAAPRSKIQSEPVSETAGTGTATKRTAIRTLIKAPAVTCLLRKRSRWRPLASSLNHLSRVSPSTSGTSLRTKDRVCLSLCAVSQPFFFAHRSWTFIACLLLYSRFPSSPSATKAVHFGVPGFCRNYYRFWPVPHWRTPWHILTNIISAICCIDIPFVVVLTILVDFLNILILQCMHITFKKTDR